MDKYRVDLTQEERTDLEGLVSAGKAAARKLIHARILLLADAATREWADDKIVEALGVSDRTIARVRKQFVTQGFDAALLRKKQPPRPDKIKIKEDLEQRLVRLVCCDPPEGHCRWTLQLLANKLVALGLTDAVSTETVRQALKKTTSSRGSSRPGVCLRTPTASTSGTWRT
jgi:hypothetical protein